MKSLPNITLSDDELDLIIEENKFDYGGEAIVCRNNNPHTLYKIFVHPDTNIPDIMSDNKRISEILYEATDNMQNVLNKLVADAYHKGYKDAMEAREFHEELCREEADEET